ncbi:AAA family ATPase [Pseudomonas sp. RIT357]|uniref:AAA family ATPase n=1 Tax=Pseudomonas sp. RIT357 TaxID=1470593 RepID=UPI00045012B5|nr:AAA family ATPase [Pseudomonas sp. RIT357]EZP67940.1 putative protein containing caspase domain protein [Pseudomonas sp. RIT357]
MPLLPPSDHYRRRLMATGTSDFLYHGQLSRVPDELDTVKAAFSSLNYQLIETGVSPSRVQMEAWVADACASCDENDLLVIYYTGHGERTDRFYLLTHDTALACAEFDRTAISIDDIARVMVRANAEQVLLILDVCHAGAGAGDFLKIAAKLANTLPVQTSAYVIAAARHSEQADEGALSAALALALSNPDCRLGGANQPYLAMEEVMETVKQYLRVNFPKQQAQFSSIHSDGICLLFPNPRHRPNLKTGLDLASQRVFDLHWSPKARGVELGASGNYFTGRTKALQQIGDWLALPDEQGRVLVVTGGAGTGKSALLGRVVTLSAAPRDAQDVQRQALEGHLYAHVPQGIVDVAVHARYKVLAEIVEQIALGFSLSERDVASVLDSLAKRQRKTVIVIDALDEADDSQDVIRQLLLPLSKLKHVFLLVGTRPDATASEQRFQALGANTLEINLDQACHLESGDVALYVERRLRADEEPERYSPYREQPELAREVALAVASRAGHVYLVAHTVVLALLNIGEAVDTSQPDWIVQLPTGLMQAFKQYLASLDKRAAGLDSATVYTVLSALAFAQGEGLPWAELWPAAASALSNRVITDEDIIQVRDFAAPFVVESIESGRSVYRLYHEQLAEQLREIVGKQPSVYRLLWDALFAAVPVDSSGKRMWANAHPYLKRHGSSFAAKAGVLDELITDPEFLLASDPEILRSHLTLRSASSYSLEQTYLSLFGTLRELPEPERRPYLALALMQRALPRLAPSAPNGLRSQWTPVWAAWNRPKNSGLIDARDSRVTALNTGLWNPDTPVALVGRADGLIEVFRLNDGHKLASWAPLRDQEVTRLALTHTPDGEVLVASWGEQLGATNLRHQQDRFALMPATAHTGEITALTIIEQEGRYFCVSANEGKQSPGRWPKRAVCENDLYLWDLADFSLVRYKTRASLATIYQLVAFKSPAGMRILSGGDTHFDAARCAPSLCLWSMDLDVLWETPATIDSGVVESIHLRQIAGITYAVTVDSLRPYSVWRADSERLTPLYFASEVVDDAWLQGEDMPVTIQVRRAGFFERFSLDLEDASASAISLEPAFRMDGCALDEFWSDTFTIDGTPCVISASVGSVNIWTLSSTPQLGGGTKELDFSPDNINCMYVDERCAASIYGGTTHGVLVGVDSATGQQTWQRKLNVPHRIRSLSGYVDAGRLTLVVASEGSIFLVGVGGEPVPDKIIEAGDQVIKLDVVWHDGEPVAFASVREGQVNAIRAWNLRTGIELNTFTNPTRTKWSYQLTGGEEDKPLQSLACHSQEAATRIVFASKYSKVMIAQYPPVRHHALDPEVFRTLRIPGSYIAQVLSITQSADGEFLAAGTDEGQIAMWHVPSLERFAVRHDTHLKGDVTALAFCDERPQLLLASGGDDGVVRFWDAELNALLQVNVAAQVRALTFLGGERLVVATQRGMVMINVEI